MDTKKLIKFKRLEPDFVSSDSKKHMMKNISRILFWKIIPLLKEWD